MSFDLAQLLVGAVFGFGSALTIRLWQYRRDLWLARVDYFCDAVDLAANTATEYWLDRRTDAGAEAARRTDICEARILGLQIRLDGLLASLEFETVGDLEQQLAYLRDGLTGGDFGGASRDSDPKRARLVQTYASDLIIASRLAAYDAVGISSTMGRCWRRALHVKRG